MKILMTVSHTGIHTGSAVQLWRLATELKSRGHNVTVALKTTKGNGSGVDERVDGMLRAGIRVKRFNFRKLKYRGTLAELKRLRKFLTMESFDVVQCFKGADFDFVYLASIGIYIPAFVVYRGMGKKLDFFNSFKYRGRRVNKIIAVSEATRNTVVASGGVDPGKVEVIYGGIDLDVFNADIDGAEARKELGIPDDVPVVGIVGSIDFRPGKNKGGYEFAKAAGLVLQERPETVFLCVGEINVNTFKPLGDELGIRDSFVFTGYRSDVNRMFAAMDVSVCASTGYEGLTGAVRESLAMETPVVASDVGGNVELVKNEQTGFTVAPGNVGELAANILKLINNPARAREMGKKGRQLVAELCDLGLQADRYEFLYYELLKQRTTAYSPVAPKIPKGAMY